MSTNKINKIYVNDTIKVENTGMTTFLFYDRKIISKKLYAIVDNILNITESTESSVSLFANTSNLKYYEYNLVLTSGFTTIAGQDVFKNIIPPVTNQMIMVFVNGKLLSKDDYTIENNKIIITSSIGSEQGSTIIILVSNDLQFIDTVNKNTLLNNNVYSLKLYQYSSDKYIFFKNDELINKNEIIQVDDYTIILNIELNDSDIITYYKLPSETTNYFFEATPGYLTYGPFDDYNRKLPEVFDTKITFSKAAKFVIDDIRKGMIIAEENGPGSAIIVGSEFENPTVNCIRINNFLSNYYGQNEYYIQVPEARSILKYISEYDLQKTLFPELLTSFQRILLDETYDSIQRLKNIRNINKVDNQHVTKLLDFLGLKIDVSDITTEQKHAVLEELSNFYKIVGTRSSYNYYNTMTNNSKIIKLEQLFTPIRNSKSIVNPSNRYITFKLATETMDGHEGAKYKKEYIFDSIDYGEVNELANTDDIYLNSSETTPRSSGKLTNPNIPPILTSTKTIYYINEEGNSVKENITIDTNPYIVSPKTGPNEATPGYDYGKITDTETDIYDYGLVSEKVSGEWITWYEWDRPKNWYPTNHVQLSAEIPPDMNYDNFMEEFKRIFYDLASTVVYIHSIVEIYTFGGNGGSGGSGGSDSGGSSGNDKRSEAGQFAINTIGGPLVVTQEYSFTSDPGRQLSPDQPTPPDPTIPDYETSYNKTTDTLTLIEYIGENPNIITPSEF